MYSPFSLIISIRCNSQLQSSSILFTKYPSFLFLFTTLIVPFPITFDISLNGLCIPFSSDLFNRVHISFVSLSLVSLTSPYSLSSFTSFHLLISVHCSHSLCQWSRVGTPPSAPPPPSPLYSLYLSLIILFLLFVMALIYLS